MFSSLASLQPLSQCRCSCVFLLSSRPHWLRLVSPPHLGSTFWHLYPPLHSDMRRYNPRYVILCYIGNPDVLTMSPVADSDGVCSWSCNSQSLPLLYKEYLQPAIICNHIPWGSYHWGTEPDYNASRGGWRAAVPMFDCISTSLHCQHCRTLFIRHVYTYRHAIRQPATVDRQGTASRERRSY